MDTLKVNEKMTAFKNWYVKQHEELTGEIIEFGDNYQVKEITQFVRDYLEAEDYNDIQKKFFDVNKFIKWVFGERDTYGVYCVFDVSSYGVRDYDFVEMGENDMDNKVYTVGNNWATDRTYFIIYE
jgi:hypothetical protein